MEVVIDGPYTMVSWGGVLALCFIVLFPLLIWPWRKRVGLGLGQATLCALGTAVAAVAAGGYRVYQLEGGSAGRGFGHSDTAMFKALASVLAAFMLSILAILFVAVLYRKWIGGKLTEEERKPGPEGFRAWLRPEELIWCALIGLCAWAAFDLSFWAILLMSVGALAAYPALVTAKQPSSQLPAPPSESMASERERILNMLEEGKITAEESAELLSALGESAVANRESGTRLGPGRRPMLIGAALLLIGFFLPWLRFDPDKELERLIGKASGQTRRMLSNMPGDINSPQFQTLLQNTRRGSMPSGSLFSQPRNMIVNVSGGQIGWQGWLALLLGLGAAALPFVAAEMTPHTEKTITYGALAIGGLILLYVFTQCFSIVGIGLVLCLAGYALEFLGAVREY
jgi:hypothetical protein